MKRCTGCAAEKPASDFYRDKQKKDGLSSRCKPCKNADNRAHFLADPTAARRGKRKWAKANPGRMRALGDRWRAANPAKVKASFAKWAKANKPKIVEWRESHREVFRKAAKNWAARHPENVKAACRNRRARIAGSSSQLTAFDWVGRLDEFCGLCAYCLVATDRPTQDHFRPLFRGGQHDCENVVPACGSCNSSKRDGLVFDWVSRGVGVCQPST